MGPRCGRARGGAGGAGGGTLTQALDVADAAAVARAATATADALGSIDVLVCSAGITGPNAPTWEYPVDAWRQVIDVNLNGLFYCNRAVVPVMLKARLRPHRQHRVGGRQGGQSERVGLQRVEGGVIGLTKSLGKELAKTGIRVNCVTPAAVRTAIFDQMSQQHIDFMLSKIPLGRFGTRRRDRGAGLLARERGVLVLDRRGVRPLRRTGNVLGATDHVLRGAPKARLPPLAVSARRA